MWSLILNSKVVRQALAVFAVIATALAYISLQKRKAVKADRIKQQEKDRNHAKGIRRRVDAVPDRKLSDDDKRGYRD